MLLIGTSEGIYQAPIDEVDDATCILDSKRVLRIRKFVAQSSQPRNRGCSVRLTAARPGLIWASPGMKSTPFL